MIRYVAVASVFIASFLANADANSHNYAWGQIKQGPMCLQGTQDRHVGAVLRICSSKVNSQRWIFTAGGNLRYQWDNGNLADECLDIPTESGGKAGTELQIWDCGHITGRSSMKWALQPVGSRFMFKTLWPNAKGECLETNKQYDVKINRCDMNNPAQLFELSPDSAFPLAKLLQLGIKTESWMEQIFASKPNTALKDIVIPGTHDSGSYEGMMPISLTQTKPFSVQLASGIRNFDLRIGGDNNIVHGISHRDSGSLEEALRDIGQFAAAHPKEIIFLDVNDLPIGDKNGMNTVLNQINKYIKPYLMSNSSIGSASQMTFEKLWTAKKNIILLVGSYAEFQKDTNRALGNLVWDKNKFMADIWPDSTTFGVIEGKNRTALQSRNANKWHLSQLIRTPRGLTPSPAQLTEQQTGDGFFALEIDKWVEDWASAGLPVNLVITDYFEWSNLVPAAIWLDWRNANQK